MRKIKEIWGSFNALDDKIFLLTVVVSICVSVIVFITDIMEGLSPVASAAVAVIFVVMVLLLYFGIHFPDKRKILRVLLVIVLNFILFPISFFFSGGIHSGMILFFLVGLFLVPVMLRGKTSIIIFILSLWAMVLMIEAAQHWPEIVVPMSMTQHYQDVKVTLLISGVGLYIITVLILNAYHQAHKRNEELMESLRMLSVKDPLSGLYNRRELYRRLEIMYEKKIPERKDTLTREHHYVAMFDIDNFKAINDTYGHDVGDSVLKRVSEVLNEVTCANNGELAARYGGEEFVCLLIADNEDEAYKRVDEARQEIEILKWEREQLHVTVSGGIVSCMVDTDLNRTMKRADELLYQAKVSGKNRICRMEGKTE